jgi:hypothetical protein
VPVRRIVPSTATRLVLAITDDLSGSAETVNLPCLRETRSQAALGSAPLARLLHEAPEPEEVVVDLDRRHSSVMIAADKLRSTQALPGLPTVLAERLPLVIAPALPALNRVVRDRVVHVDGVPLSATWRVKSSSPPESVPAALEPVPTRTIGLDAVRSQQLASAGADCAGRSLIVVCDTESDEDLDTIVHWTLEPSPVGLVGSGGAVAALDRRRKGPAHRSCGRGDSRLGVGRPEPTDPANRGATSTATGPLVVLGGVEPGVARQVELSADSGIGRSCCPTRTAGRARPGVRRPVPATRVLGRAPTCPSAGRRGRAPHNTHRRFSARAHR